MVGERFIQNVSGLVLRLSAGEPARRSLTAQRLRHLLPDRLGVIWIQRRAAGGALPASQPRRCIPRRIRPSAIWPRGSRFRERSLGGSDSGVLGLTRGFAGIMEFPLVRLVHGPAVHHRGPSAAHQGIPSWGCSDGAAVRSVHCAGRWGQTSSARSSWSWRTLRAVAASGSQPAAVIAAPRTASRGLGDMAALRVSCQRPPGGACRRWTCGGGAASRSRGKGF